MPAVPMPVNLRPYHNRIPHYHHNVVYKDWVCASVISNCPPLIFPCRLFLVPPTALSQTHTLAGRPLAAPLYHIPLMQPF
jgi:hypothetical protein